MIFFFFLNFSALNYSPIYLGPHGVFDAHHAEAREPGEDVALVVPVGLAVLHGEIPVRQADGPQAFGGHGLDHFLRHVVAVARAKHLGLAGRRQDLVAPGSRGGEK